MPTNLSFTLNANQIQFIQTHILPNLENSEVDFDAINELSEDAFPDICEYEEVLAFYNWC